MSESPDEQYQAPEINEVALRDALKEFYAIYNPDRIGSIDVILEKYRNEECQMLEHLMEKYSASEFKPFLDYLNNHQNTIGNVTENKVTGKETKDSSAVPENNAGTVASNPNSSSFSVQDLSSDIAQRFLSGWSKVSSTIVSDSISIVPMSIDESKSQFKSSADLDKAAYEEMIKDLKNQILTVVSENSNLRGEAKKHQSEIETLNEELKNSQNDSRSKQEELVALREKCNSLQVISSDFEKELKMVSTQKLNKQQQLRDVIGINQRLGAQVRFLTSCAFRLHSDNKQYVSLTTRNSENMLDTINKDDSNSPKDWNGFVPFSSIVDSIPTALELSTRLSNILGINLRHEDSSIETKDTQNKVLLQSMSDNNLLINSDLSTSARVTLDDEKWTGLVDAIEVLFTSFVGGQVELQHVMKDVRDLQFQVQQQEILIKELNETVANYEQDSVSLEALMEGNSSSNQAVSITNDDFAARQRCKVLEEKNLVLIKEVNALKTSMNASRRAKEDQHAAYQEIIRALEEKLWEEFNRKLEHLLLEKEDLESYLLKVIDNDEKFVALAKSDMFRELCRLREEIFALKKSLNTRDEQLRFLESQLLDSIERINELSDIISSLRAPNMLSTAM